MLKQLFFLKTQKSNQCEISPEQEIIKKIVLKNIEQKEKDIYINKKNAYSEIKFISKFKNISKKLYAVIFPLFKSDDEIYYINGPETLPPPLTKAEETEVLSKITAGLPNAREPLVTHNLRLVVYIAKKFDNVNINIEDLISIGTIGLVKAVNTFCPTKNIKFATYASRCIENEILMHLRKTNAQKNETSIDEPLNVDWDGNELLLSDILGSDSNLVTYKIEQETECNLVLKAVNDLSERDKLIMELRFGLNGKKEHTQKEVADLLEISQSYISRLEKKIIEKLKKDLEKIQAY